MARKVSLAIGLIIVLSLFGGMLLFIGLSQVEDQTQCEPSGVQVVGDSSSLGSLTVKGSPITVPQLKNATAIVQVAIESDLSPLTAGKIAIMTAMQEATLNNIAYGYPGSSSVGLFQQIAAWGPYSVRMNPRKSAYMFYFGGQQGQRGLTDVPGWEAMSPGDAAQQVQQSGYPDAYDQHEAEAEAIVRAIVSKIGTVAPVGYTEDCEELDRIEIAVRAALSRIGDDYEWDDKNGSGLVSWAFSEADITLPSDLASLQDYDGNESEGIEATHLSADDVKTSSSLERGDVVFWSTDEDADPEQVGVELGDEGLYAGSEFRIATYNITVKRQFANYDLAVRNITSTFNMDIVGTQELVGDSYRKVQQLTKASGYGIYPDYKPGLRTVRHGLNGRAIIYNKDRFVLDRSQTDMFRHPRYPDDRAARIGKEQVLAGQANVPVAYFTDRTTGQPIIVVNFHNVAYARYAKRRYQSNLILVDQIKRLQATHPGVPIFMTGDFNEGTGVRRPGDGANLTYELDHRNLLYCMFASNGLMQSAEALSRGEKTSCPNRSRGGVDYIYVTPEVNVARGDFKVIPRGRSGSDHPAMYADVGVPRAGGEKLRRTKHTSIAVTYHEGAVELSKFSTRDVVGVLRLTVTDQVSLLNVSGEGWVFPLKKGTYTFSADSYGPRSLNGDDFHNGTDFGTGGGTPPLIAMHDGTIVRWGYAGAWGNYLVVETNVPVPGSIGNTFKYLYGHLSSYAQGVGMGDAVQAGQQLGNVGNTGNSFGEHLHLTICTTMDCTYGNAEGSVDPIPFLASVGIRP